MESLKKTSIMSEHKRNTPDKAKNSIYKSTKRYVTLSAKNDEDLNNWLAMCNDKKSGKTITRSDIFAHLLTFMSSSEVKKIQEASLSLDDKISIQTDLYNKKNNCNISEKEFIAIKLKIQ